MSLDAWISDQQIRGEKVQLFRDYADGSHRASMTAEMKALLRVGNGDSTFALNRLDNVVQTFNDRLEVQRILDTGDTANKWIEELLDANRFDALQTEVHESAIRDADSFMVVDFDNETQQVRLIHEPAYDGVAGMLVLYEKRSRSEIIAAIKVWHVTSTGGNVADTMRVNVYYADRIEKFVADNGQQLRPFTDDSTDTNGIARWVMPDGTPIGVPVVHFKNRAQPYDNYGRSEIDDAVPLNDALNRMLHSLIVSAELTAFRNLVAKGFQPPAGLTPGAWIVIGGDGLTKDDVADASVLEAGEITPYIDASKFLIQQIDEITRTPNPETMGSSDSSGESLKQREIGLLGKVKRAQISFGNSWEDTIALAQRVQSAFGELPPQYTYLSTQWRSPEIRNRSEVVKNAIALQGLIGREASIRLISEDFDFSEDQIQAMLASTTQTQQIQQQQLPQASQIT